MKILNVREITVADNDNFAPDVIPIPKPTYTSTLSYEQHQEWLSALDAPDAFNQRHSKKPKS